MERRIERGFIKLCINETKNNHIAIILISNTLYIYIFNFTNILLISVLLQSLNTVLPNNNQSTVLQHVVNQNYERSKLLKTLNYMYE